MHNVQVFLSTYNGEKYLDEQIESLLRQVDVNISILVRDDGSTDSTKVILEKWRINGSITWYEGQNLKPAHSFLDLINNAIDVDYYAFCDQDDVWNENKLKEAIDVLKENDNTKPLLYYSRLGPVDENLNPLNYYFDNKGDTLGRAMLVSYAAGCTMVFNKALLSLVHEYTPGFLRMHDHWLYLICIAVDGGIYYDPSIHIKYRQHVSNTVGFKAGIIKRLKRLWYSFNNGNNERWRQVKELEEGYSGIIPEKNLKLIRKVVQYNKSWENKIDLILDRDIKSKSFKKDIMLATAIIFGRL